MDLALVFPGLLDSAPSAFTDADALAPALARLLAFSQAPETAGDGTAAVACSALGIARQRDWPVAPWLARAAGIDSHAPYWLCAEPATFTLGYADARLAGLVHDLSEEDSAALLHTLNTHFASDAIRFFSTGPSRWLLGVASVQALQTYSPEDVGDDSVVRFMPAGPDAPRWHRWQNEMQMLLFEHPVNRKREQSGLPSLNAVWLWGGGTLARLREPTPVATYADAWMPGQLARAAGASVAAVPASFASLPPGGSAMVWLDAFDIAGTRTLASRLSMIDEAWVAPVAQALSSRAVLNFGIVLTGRRRALRFSVKRPSFVQRMRMRGSPRLGASLRTHLTGV